MKHQSPLIIHIFILGFTTFSLKSLLERGQIFAKDEITQFSIILISCVGRSVDILQKHHQMIITQKSDITEIQYVILISGLASHLFLLYRQLHAVSFR